MKIKLYLKGFTKIVDVPYHIIERGLFSYAAPQEMPPVTPNTSEVPMQDVEVIDFRPDRYGIWRPV